MHQVLVHESNLLVLPLLVALIEHVVSCQMVYEDALVPTVCLIGLRRGRGGEVRYPRWWGGESKTSKYILQTVVRMHIMLETDPYLWNTKLRYVRGSDEGGTWFSPEAEAEADSAWWVLGWRKYKPNPEFSISYSHVHDGDGVGRPKLVETWNRGLFIRAWSDLL